MQIKKITTDRKPKTCMPCILKHLHDCGTFQKRQEDSGGARTEKVPDKRCLIKVG